jgi:hypothetical protein
MEARGERDSGAEVGAGSMSAMTELRNRRRAIMFMIVGAVLLLILMVVFGWIVTVMCNPIARHPAPPRHQREHNPP